MSDLRLAQAFRDLDQAVPTGHLDREALDTAIAAAQRRRIRRRTFATSVAVLAVGIAAVFLGSSSSHRDTLVPANVEPTPTIAPFNRGGAQPGRIGFLPKGSGTVDLPDHGGSTHYEYYRVPHSQAETRKHFTPGDLIQLGVTYNPDLPEGTNKGASVPVQLSHAKGEYFAPSGTYNLAVIAWFDGLFHYRLQAPLLDQAHPVGLTYDDLLMVANSIGQGTPALPPSDFSPMPKPNGYLESPGPDVLACWSPYFYAKRPPTDPHPKITAEQALTTERTQSFAGKSHGTTAPDEYLAQVSFISPIPASQSRGRSSSYRDRLAWVISFGGMKTDDTQGHNYTGCTDLYIVDATTGEPFHDETFCPRTPKATPTRSP